MPATIVRADSAETVRAVFSRINDSGKRPAADEVFDALHSARSAPSPASLEEIATDLKDFGFGEVERSLLHRLLRVLAATEAGGVATQRPMRLSEAEAEADAGAACRRTALAATRAVQFVQ